MVDFFNFIRWRNIYIVSSTYYTLIILKCGANMSKRVQVNFTDEQYDLLQKLKGELGNSDSDVVKNITMAWLTEKSFISTTLKTKIFGE